MAIHFLAALDVQAVGGQESARKRACFGQQVERDRIAQREHGCRRAPSPQRTAVPSALDAAVPHPEKNGQTFKHRRFTKYSILDYFVNHELAAPMIGARLKLARTAAGLSLRDLEQRLEGLVTAQAIGKYERDAMMPSSSVLIALARALGVTEDYLLNPADVDLVAVEFRKRKLASAREAAEVRARVLSEVERYLQIEEILAIEARNESPTGGRQAVRSAEGIERAAEKLRERWNLGEDAIPNLCEFLEEKGVKICAIPLPERVSGVQATVMAADGTSIPAIIINSQDPGERQRFTLAHELGHLYLQIGGDLDPESACHRFAGAFLVPRMTLEREVGKYRHVISLRELFQLKLLFGVSAQAIAYRCKDLGLISQATAAGIFRTFNARGWRKSEPLPMRKEGPSRFERLCIRALAEDLISEGKASELLQKTVREVVDSLDEPPAAEAIDGHPPRL